jgi:cellulose synthase/poly-beta-1,6-N-acetylglucosamine synthase-like glycosyltransferase
MGALAEFLIFFIAGTTAVYAFYNVFIGLFGWGAPRALPRATAKRRFAILIPAHNEERVLEPLLQSLEDQHYPRTCFDVYVSADHCSDGTVDLARRAGATVLERHGQAQRGKTWNLRWALSRLPVNDYDAVIVFDADNLVQPEFLEAINDHFEAHPEALAVQGYLGVKNPDDSWVTRAIAISYWFGNRFCQAARAKHGWFCMLGGTGMALRPAVIERFVGQLESLVDDLELTTLLALEGHTVGWCEHAVVYDEKPVRLSMSLRQRQRWMQGHFWVLGRYGPRALLQFLRSGRGLHLDALAVLIWPAVTLGGLLIGLLQFVRWLWTEQLGIFTHAEPWLSWAIPVLVLAVVQALIGASLRSGRWTWRYAFAAPGYVLFGFSWLVALVGGLIASRNQGHWAKTEHTRAILHRDVRRDLE